jgi:hypothetical protein
MAVIPRRRKRRGPTRVRFQTDGAKRKLTIEGFELSDVEQQRLRRLLRPLPIRSGVVVIRTDWAGRRRVSFSGDIPEGTQQVIRNLVGNLTRLRSI